jgi:hypothetical protein
MRLVPKNDLTQDGKSTSASSRSQLLHSLFFLIGSKRPSSDDKKVIYDTEANLLITSNLDASSASMHKFFGHETCKGRIKLSYLHTAAEKKNNEFRSVID